MLHTLTAKMFAAENFGGFRENFIPQNVQFYFANRENVRRLCGIYFCEFGQFSHQPRKFHHAKYFFSVNLSAAKFSIVSSKHKTLKYKHRHSMSASACTEVVVIGSRERTRTNPADQILQMFNNFEKWKNHTLTVACYVLVHSRLKLYLTLAQ